MASKVDTQPFLQNDHLEAPTDNNPITQSPDLTYSLDSDQNNSSPQHSLAIPRPSSTEQFMQSQDEYSYRQSLGSPPSPQIEPPIDEVLGKTSNDFIDLSSSKHTKPSISLSKKLFNLEHYIIIPIMFLLAFFVYYDRGGLASALDPIQDQLLGGNSVSSGTMASCYLFGYCFTSPIFAVLGSRYPPIKMSAIGMVVWCIGAFLTGWPGPSFISNLVWLGGARLLTGIGEGSFLAFAGTIIDVIAPDTSRSLWLGTFYMGIPLGYAMGYAVGGTIVDMTIYVTNSCDSAWFDDGNTDCNESWRAVFISETFLVIPLCIVLYCITQPPNMLVIKQAKDELQEQAMTEDSNMTVPSQRKQSEDLHDAPVMTKIFRILTNKTFLCCCIGYALQNFVVGTFAVDAIVYLQKVFGWNSSKAGTTFGIITFFSGVFGSVVGGVVLDKLKGRLEPNSPDYMYCKPAFKLLAVISFLAFPFAFIVVIWNNIPVFIIGAALTEFLIFMSVGPVNNVILWSVLYEDRPLAASINTLAIHAFGDALAPIVVGALVKSQENIGKDEAFAYNFAFGIAAFWLIFSGIAFIFGICTMNWLEKWMIRQGQTRRKTSLLINDPSH